MNDRIGPYEHSRRKFACIVYLVTLIWLLLALAQWLVVCLVEPIKEIFYKYEWISVIFFALAIILTMIFIFFEQSRSVPCLNWLITFLIVEFVTIGLFAVVVRALWPDLVMWFIICILLLFLFVLLSFVINHDLTLDVVILFVISFVFLIMSVFLIMCFILTRLPHYFILYHIFVSIVILMFVMYHAQTINGGRFAEMRLNDYLLATIILFYEYIVLFLLSFYVMINFKIASNEIIKSKTTTT